MAHQPWHIEGLLTGGPMGASPYSPRGIDAQLAWRRQLGGYAPDSQDLIKKRLQVTEIEAPDDVSALVSVDDSPSNVGDAAAAGLSGAGQYVSGLFETPEWNPMRKPENLGFPSFRRGTWSRSV